MTEREKMIKVLRDNIEYELRDYPDDHYVGVTFNYGAIADALTAAGIGDVTEWKEKVECAKRILQIPTLPNGKTDLSYFEYKGERIQDIARQRDEYKHRAEVAEKERDEYRKSTHIALRGIEILKRNILRYFAAEFPSILQQAEREIEEEKEE